MKPFFTHPLTDDELYWAGFIHADGSLSRDRRVIFAQKDRFAVDEFLRFFDQSSKVSYRNRETTYGHGESYVASTMKGYDGLVSLGVKGEVVDELYKSRHFWRGLIDGDGGIYIDKRGVPIVNLCSGKGPRDVVAFSEWVGSLFGTKGPKPYLDKKGVWYAYQCSSKARLLGPYLYENGYSAVPRKRDKALSFREIIARSRIEILSQD